MKKSYFNYTIRALNVLLAVLICSFAFTACDDDDNDKAEMHITGIYLEMPLQTFPTEKWSLPVWDN